MVDFKDSRDKTIELLKVLKAKEKKQKMKSYRLDDKTIVFAKHDGIVEEIKDKIS